MSNNLFNPTAGPTGPAGTSISTQTDVTALRAIDGTVYQNALTRSIFVLIQSNLSTGGTVILYSDSNVSPVLTIGALSNNNLAQMALLIGTWILPGNYYKVTGTLSTLTRWIEYS